MRRNKAVRLVEEMNLRNNRLQPLFDDDHAAADEIDTRLALEDALHALAPEHQLVVHLRLVEGLPFDDVARVMNRSVGACQMLMLRAALAPAALEAEEYAVLTSSASPLDLDRALSGEDAGDEARELAALLAAAVLPVRRPVTEAELELALCSVRPGANVSALRPALGLALAVAVAAAPSPRGFVRTPGTDVQARRQARWAARFSSSRRCAPALPAHDVAGYVDGRTGRAHCGSRRAGAVSARRFVLHPNGSVERWLAASRIRQRSHRTAALPGGCAEASTRSISTSNRRTSARPPPRGRVRAGRSMRIASIRSSPSTPRTFLPRRIDWRQNGRRVSVTRFVALERQRTPVSADSGRCRSILAPAPFSSRRAAPAFACCRCDGRASPRGARWLGPSYDGARARVERVRMTGETRHGSVRPGRRLELQDGCSPGCSGNGAVCRRRCSKSPAASSTHLSRRTAVVADATFADGNAAVVSAGGTRSTRSAPCKGSRRAD
jgi:hypothetical protein